MHGTKVAKAKAPLTKKEVVLMDSSEAVFELTLLNAESSKYEFEDFYVWGVKKGIPAEVLTRLKDLWGSVQLIGGELVSIGKIIISTLREFLILHPKLSAGLVLGLAVGFLVSSVPLLGPILGGIAALYLTGMGASLDEGTELSEVTSVGAIKALLAKLFELLVKIINSVGEQWGK